MRCSNIQKKIALLAAGELSGWQKRRVERHCQTCADCRQQQEQTRLLWARLRGSNSEPTPERVGLAVFAALSAESQPSPTPANISAPAFGDWQATQTMEPEHYATSTWQRVCARMPALETAYLTAVDFVMEFPRPRRRPARIACALVALTALSVATPKAYRQYRNNVQRNLNTSLIAAVQAKNVAAVRVWLERGADPNSRAAPLNDRGPGLRALDVVVQLRQSISPDEEKIACLLVQHGADISGKNGSYYLSTACESGGTALVRYLLDHGVAPNHAGHARQTPLDAAIGYATGYSLFMGFNTPQAQYEAMIRQRTPTSRELVRLLQAHGVRLNLWQAARVDDVEAVRANLDAGTPIDQAEHQGNHISTFKEPTALILAAHAGSIHAARLLVARGANINARSVNPDTPLMGAIRGKHLEIARLLLNRGANVNTSDTRDYPPLAEACSYLPVLVPEMLQRGADLKMTGGPALRAAIRAKNPELARLLLARMTRAHVKIGYAVLQTAVQEQPEFVLPLLARGADARETSQQADSLIWYAVHNKRKDLLAPLLRAGANINAQHVGSTPLSEALVQDADTVELLLNKGADPNMAFHSGQTPLIATAQAGNASLARLLLAHGAAVNAKGRLGHTPLYFARRHNYPAVIALLERAGGKEE